MRIRFTALALLLVPFACARASCGAEEKNAQRDALQELYDGHALPGVVAMTSADGVTLPTRVRALVAAYARGEATPGFPLPVSGGDRLRFVDGMRADLVITWLTPLSNRNSPNAPRFGGNNDYLAYFGDDWGPTPYYSGADESGWLWVNHEYVSGRAPSAAAGPTGQMATLARFLRAQSGSDQEGGWTESDIAGFVRAHKRQLGGSWIRVKRERETGRWSFDPAAENQRYDASSRTQFRMTGPYAGSVRDHEDSDPMRPLPPGVIAGTMANCAGGVTPWGTVIASEENTQYFYGDAEPVWDRNAQLAAGVGFDAGEPIRLATTGDPSANMGGHDAAGELHSPTYYGWQAEVEPGRPAGEFLGAARDDTGHAKHSSLGRARWESAAFVLEKRPEGHLAPPEGKPLVVYFGDDRYNGRVHKFVSRDVWRDADGRARQRALLHEGTLYVSHLDGLSLDGFTLRATGKVPPATAPGVGRWIELSLRSTDIAPNASAFAEGTTVGAALRDLTWNRLGGYASQGDVLASVYTAAAKIGAAEQNRPEDVEWNFVDQSLYIAYTRHTGRPSLNEHGVVTDDLPKRKDAVGRIWNFREYGDPATSRTFGFHQVWEGKQSQTDVFAATNPDNLLIDADGGVWFGTDGNFGNNGQTSDAVYYLDLDPAHHDTKRATYGRAFRIAAVPSDAEATGIALTSRMSTLFLSVQHPGERESSRWPGNQFPRK